MEEAEAYQKDRLVCLPREESFKRRADRGRTTNGAV